MSKYPVFPNAPITEAVLDIRVLLSEEINVEDLKKAFHDSIKKRFTVIRKQDFFEGAFKILPEVAPVKPSTVRTRGYLFNSPEEKKTVQARLDGFTFNKLKPYESWERFNSEAFELWELYCGIARPEKINRVALRYINKIELPLPFSDFREYILTIPEVAPGLPYGLSQFFMQLTIPHPEIQATAIINQTMEPPSSNNRLPIIFDIDVFKLAEYSHDDPRVKEDFETLRDFKNDIFFKSVTEKTKELFR